MPKVHPNLLARVIFHTDGSPDEATRRLVQAGFPEPRPLIRSVSAERLRRAEKEASEGPFPPLRSLTEYHAVDLDEQVERVDECLAVLCDVPSVTGAYARKGLAETTTDYSSRQRYRLGAAEGIGADALPGATGAGTHFVDIERGWNVDHIDLQLAGPTLGKNLLDDVTGIPYGDIAWTAVHHGTSVLGIVVGRASDPEEGIVGIAPDASVTLLSILEPDGTEADLADRLGKALDAPVGAVVLIEESLSCGAIAEMEEDTFHAIRLLSACGRVVIECAGNRSSEIVFPSDHPGSTDDSGAIVVAAATARGGEGGTDATVHYKMSSSNWGSRVDCFAWGEGICTAGAGDLDDTGGVDALYTASFGDTSGAGAIVAGAALLLQERAWAENGAPLTALQMRRLLRVGGTWDTVRGGALYKPIGLMPNLAEAINHLALPDVYVRDHLLDEGVPPTVGVISASPDITISPIGPGLALPSTVPKSVYGTGGRLVGGRTEWVYVRIGNRGSASGIKVEARVYWAPCATVPDVTTWNHIGTTGMLHVPTGPGMQILPPIEWPVSHQPPPGDYCFIVVLGAPSDPPGPTPPPITRLSDFSAWIRSNNNVAWRNFSVLSVGMTPGSFELSHDGASFDLHTSVDVGSGVRVGIPVPTSIALAVDAAYDTGVSPYAPGWSVMWLPDGEFRFAAFPLLGPTPTRWVVSGTLAKGDRASLVQVKAGRAVGGVHWRIGAGPIARVTLP